MAELYVIPARGGSKGLEKKNIRPLNGKPLIGYSIDVARKFTGDENICVSSDDPEIIKVVEEKCGLKVPFIRPAELATDTAGTHEVLLHAIDHFEKQGKSYNTLVLLQPTSPLRTDTDLAGALELYRNSGGVDMVVSVKTTKANPYFTLFEENSEKFLRPSKVADFTRRQDCPPVYEYNGAIYVINVASLKQKPMRDFQRIKKYLMAEINSVDIDTALDFNIAEYLMKEYIPHA